ncbi:MAG: MSCRAMM family protein [Gemmatimonadaceae bacterium]
MSKPMRILTGMLVALPLTLAAQQRDSVQLPLPGPGVLHGFVADSMERPLDGAEVVIQSLRLSVLTGPDGSFRFENIKPGRYQVSARKIGYYPSGRVVTVGDNGGATAVWLVRRETATLPPVVSTARRGGLSGVVGDTAYNAIRGAEVSVLASDRRTQSDSTGAFFLDLKPGRHMIRVEREGYGSQLLSVTIPKDSGRRMMVWLSSASRGFVAWQSHMIEEFSMRLARRNPVWSRIYTREDITRTGYDRARELVTAGAAHPISDECIAFIDGDTTRKRPIWALDAGDIETLEVYSYAKPPRAAVRSIGGGGNRAPGTGGRPGCPAVYVWLRD